MYAKVAGPREQDISISILLNLVPYHMMTIIIILSWWIYPREMETGYHFIH